MERADLRRDGVNDPSGDVLVPVARDDSARDRAALVALFSPPFLKEADLGKAPANLWNAAGLGKSGLRTAQQKGTWGCW